MVRDRRPWGAARKPGSAVPAVRCGGLNPCGAYAGALVTIYNPGWGPAESAAWQSAPLSGNENRDAERGWFHRVFAQTL